MRLDKYLKVARILKRRTVSKELAANERVMINGRIAKPAKEVNIGDVIDIVYGERGLQIRVLDIKENVRKNDAGILYEVIKEYKIEETDQQL